MINLHVHFEKALRQIVIHQIYSLFTKSCFVKSLNKQWNRCDSCQNLGWFQKMDIRKWNIHNNVLQNIVKILTCIVAAFNLVYFFSNIWNAFTFLCTLLLRAVKVIIPEKKDELAFCVTHSGNICEISNKTYEVASCYEFK